MRRRHFTSLLGAAGVGLWGGRAETAELLISDTHSHSMLRPQDPSCLKCELGDARVSLVSWALGSDGPFIQRLPNGAMQVNLKATPEQYREVYTRMLRGMGARIRRENLRLAKTSADVDLALAGELHLVLSTEGAHFLGGELAYLDTVYAQGVRQIGLGHFVEGDLLDIRTEMPKLGGLSALGGDVIRRCNALGIVVDLAHATDQAVAQALAISSQPMLWSHSNITRFATNWRSTGNQIMSISLDNAKVLAAKGGVVGVWPSRFNFDNPSAYVEGLQAAIDMIGADHVAFGSDMQGLSPSSTMMDNYSGLRSIVNLMLSKNMPEVVVRKVASENYARLLKAVFDGRTG